MADAAEMRSLLIKPASGDCNLHCTYCFYHERATDPYKDQTIHRMSPEVLDTLIQQGMALDRRQATFGWQGGEPTLAGLDFFRQVIALQKKYGHRGQAVSNGLQTNSLLLTPEWADFLHEYNWLIGVSLDGPAEYHDQFRIHRNGRPTHAQVVAQLKMLEEHKVEYNVLCVVNNVTADHGPEIFDYFLNQGYTFMQFIPCVEVDPVTNEIADFSVTPEQYAKFLCQIFDKWYNNGNPVASIRDFEALLAVYVGQQAPLCCYQKNCGSYLVVEYNGDLYPCDFLVKDTLLMGNIMETPLTEVFDSPKVAAFKVKKADPRPECDVCAWQPLCNQGCYRFVNLLGQHRNYLCRSYQIFFAHAHERFMELRLQVLHNMGLDPTRVPAPPAISLERNDLCPCGSGRKFKQCCGKRR